MTTLATHALGDKPDELMSLWTGMARVEDGCRLIAPLGRFVAIGVRVGDVASYEKDGKTVRVPVLHVIGEESMVIGGEPIGSTELLITVGRHIANPCEACTKAGTAAESDHRHCLRCRIRVESDVKTRHCTACILDMRKAMIKSNRVEETVGLYGGKRTIKIHCRTVSEVDAINEWQDALWIANPKISDVFLLEEAGKAAVAFSLDDDGFKRKPADLIAEETTGMPSTRIPIMFEFFRAISDSLYKTYLSSVHRLDTLSEEACLYTFDEKQTEDEVLELAEKLGTATDTVTGVVHIWDGLETLVFADPPRFEVDEATKFANDFIQDNHGKMLEGRENNIITLLRLSAMFRGDSKVKFDKDSIIGERLDYLMTLPMPLYYLYVIAASVWQRRVIKAGQVEVLGNF